MSRLISPEYDDVIILGFRCKNKNKKLIWLTDLVFEISFDGVIVIIVTE